MSNDAARASDCRIASARLAWLHVAIAATVLASCSVRDVVATRPVRDGGASDATSDGASDATSDGDVDSGFDASADTGVDAGLDPITNCPGPVTIPGAPTPCSAALAASVFTHGYCSTFSGLSSNVDFRVDAFDSDLGPYASGAANLGASVGKVRAWLAPSGSVAVIVTSAPPGPEIAGARVTMKPPLPLMPGAMLESVMPESGRNVGSDELAASVSVSGARPSS